MKRFAISNIGWNISWEDDIMFFLPEKGFTWIEVSPTIWDVWDEIDIKHVTRYKCRLDDYGTVVTVFQMIYFWKT